MIWWWKVPSYLLIPLYAYVCFHLPFCFFTSYFSCILSHLFVRLVNIIYDVVRQYCVVVLFQVWNKNRHFCVGGDTSYSYCITPIRYFSFYHTSHCRFQKLTRKWEKKNSRSVKIKQNTPYFSRIYKFIENAGKNQSKFQNINRKFCCWPPCNQNSRYFQGNK